MPYNLPLNVFRQRNSVADFFEKSPNFYTENEKNSPSPFAKKPPSQNFTRISNKLNSLWGLGATYAVHLRLIGKLVVDFLLVTIELFFASCFRCHNPRV